MLLWNILKKELQTTVSTKFCIYLGKLALSIIDKRKGCALNLMCINSTDENIKNGDPRLDLKFENNEVKFRYVDQNGIIKANWLKLSLEEKYLNELKVILSTKKGVIDDYTNKQLEEKMKKVMIKYYENDARQYYRKFSKIINKVFHGYPKKKKYGHSFESGEYVFVIRDFYLQAKIKKNASEKVQHIFNHLLKKYKFVDGKDEAISTILTLYSETQINNRSIKIAQAILEASSPLGFFTWFCCDNNKKINIEKLAIELRNIKTSSECKKNYCPLNY